MIRVDDDGDVRTVTLARPERRNAVTPAGLKALADAVTGAETPVVHLRGAGEAFCAGADRSVVADLAAAVDDGDGADDDGADGNAGDAVESFVRRGQATTDAIDDDRLGVGDGVGRGLSPADERLDGVAGVVVCAVVDRRREVGDDRAVGPGAERLPGAPEMDDRRLGVGDDVGQCLQPRRGDRVASLRTGQRHRPDVTVVVDANHTGGTSPFPKVFAIPSPT